MPEQSNWLPEIGELVWVGDSYRTVDKRGKARGGTWLTCDGVLYPLLQCSPLCPAVLSPEDIQAHIQDLAEVQTSEQAAFIVNGLPEDQKRRVWEACPTALKTRLINLKKESQPQLLN